MRAYLFLDVDGVVSALSSRHGFGDGRRHRVDGFDLTLSKSLGLRLRALDVDVLWLTTWGEQANDIGRLIGLPEYPIAGSPPNGATSSGPWKLDLVRERVQGERRPFVWADDDAIGPEAEVWAGGIDVPNLLIKPRSNRGLTPADVDAVEVFATRIEKAP